MCWDQIWTCWDHNGHDLTMLSSQAHLQTPYCACAGCAAVGGAEAASSHCQSHCSQSQGAAAGRSHSGSGHALREGSTGSLGWPYEGQDNHHCGPPPVHHRQCLQHRRCTHSGMFPAPGASLGTIVNTFTLADGTRASVHGMPAACAQICWGWLCLHGAGLHAQSLSGQCCTDVCSGPCPPVFCRGSLLLPMRGLPAFIAYHAKSKQVRPGRPGSHGSG